MRWLVGFLADRDSSTVRSLALGAATLIFSVLVVEVQPHLVGLDPLLQLLIAAVSLGTLVTFLEWLLQWLRTRDIRGEWVYRSSAGNWGLATISQIGFDLGYEVQLYATRAGVEAALAGQPVLANEVLGHTTSTFCEFKDHTVSIRYVIGRSRTNYERREGFLELVPQGPGSENLVGYWTSTLEGARGELYLTRPTSPENIASLEIDNQAPGAGEDTHE